MVDEQRKNIKDIDTRRDLLKYSLLGLVILGAVGLASMRWFNRYGNWERRFQPGIQSVTLAGGVLLVHQFNDKIFAVNCESGDRCWEVKIPGKNQDIKFLDVVESKLIVLSGMTLYCLNMDTHEVIWSYRFQSDVKLAVCKKQSKIIACDGRVYTFSLGSGTPLWQSESANARFDSLAVNDDNIYVKSTGRSGIVYCLRVDDGHLRWKLETSSSPDNALSSSVLIMRDEISGSLSGYNALTGVRLWSDVKWANLIQGDLWISAVDGDMIYGSNYNGDVIKIKALDGRLVWHAKTKDRIRGGISCRDGEILVGAGIGKVYVINTVTGKIMQVIDVSSLYDRMSPTNLFVAGCTNQPLIGANGVVYISTEFGLITRVMIK